MIKAIIIIFLWVISFFPVYPDLFRAWISHSNNSHCILVPFISGYFIWNKRLEFHPDKISNSYLGLCILTLSMILYIISYAGSIAFISRLMIVISLVGMVLYVLGKEIFVLYAFPLFFLLFMIPIPDSIRGFIAFPLQIFATNISAAIINFLSIPVYQEGNMLYFAKTQLEVAEACSGLRSITAMLMISVIFAYMMKKGKWNKVFILISAVPIAILANIVRVTGTGILAHFYGEKIARGFLHEFSGIAVFVFGLTVLLIESNLLIKLNDRKLKYYKTR